jgi:hypothetical protein
MLPRRGSRVGEGDLAGPEPDALIAWAASAPSPALRRHQVAARGTSADAIAELES